MTIAIRDIALPERVDDDSDDARTFRARIALVTAVNDARYGTGVVSVSPQESLAGARSTQHHEVLHVGAFEGDALVGVLTGWVGLVESTDVIDMASDVDPALPVDERARIHEALVEEGMQQAARRGRSTVLGGSPGAAAAPIMAATGFGGVDPDEPAAAPLVVRGFSLEQVYRVSVADLAALDDLDARLAAALERASDYRVVGWEGDVPAEHREGMWTLHGRMSTDAPIGALELEPEVWDEERLAMFEAMQRDGGRTSVTVAAQHVATGELVGFSTLFVPPEGDVAKQHDTLVAAPHRGHGLGMLLKLANLRALDAHPRIARVSTWNAEENRPMLDVNEAVGFEPVGYEAVWQLRGRAGAGS